MKYLFFVLLLPFTTTAVHAQNSFIGPATEAEALKKEKPKTIVYVMRSSLGNTESFPPSSSTIEYRIVDVEEQIPGYVPQPTPRHVCRPQGYTGYGTRVSSYEHSPYYRTEYGEVERLRRENLMLRATLLGALYMMTR